MAVAAISAITPLAGFSSVTPIGGLSASSAPPAGAAATKAPSINFADALHNVQSSIDNADVLSQQLATGELTDIHDYTVAASKAQLGVQLTVALRNQLMSSFQEVMRMQM